MKTASVSTVLLRVLGLIYFAAGVLTFFFLMQDAPIDNTRSIYLVIGVAALLQGAGACLFFNVVAEIAEHVATLAKSHFNPSSKS